MSIIQGAEIKSYPHSANSKFNPFEEKNPGLDLKNYHARFNDDNILRVG